MKWYLVQTKSKQEKRAVKSLEQNHFEIYCPEMFVKTRKGKKLELMFPGYLFAQLDINTSRFDKVKNTPGVIDLVAFTEYPLAVRPEIIESIKAQQQEINRAPNGDYFEPGETVVVTAGPFRNLVGVLQQSSGKERVRLLMSCMGSTSIAQIDINHIERV